MINRLVLVCITLFNINLQALNAYADEPPCENISRKAIIVDLILKQWIACQDSKEVASGEANGGAKRCKETGLYRCFTPIGVWQITKKYGHVKRSKLYPIECKDKTVCGFPMLWYMIFAPDGAGFHGVRGKLTGKNTSHGCVRLNIEDARWLSQEFAEIGTTVIVLPY